MNINFLPNENEETLIQIIQSKCRNEFVLIRMTETMLKKSIIDASEGLRLLLLKNNIIDFHEIAKRDKILKKTFLVTKNKIFEVYTSYYRPQSKDGDPRFWIYGLKKLAEKNVLVYFTYHNNNLVAIPLIAGDFEEALNELFEIEINNILIQELKLLIAATKAKGFIKSQSPFKSNPKDVGNTLELALGLELNSLAKADYKGKIEIKTKRKHSRTKDSLFSCVPNWCESTVKSATEMILQYGYESDVHPGYFDLYVTVGNKPNSRGLFLDPQNSIERLLQYYVSENKKTETVFWDYSVLNKRLNEKHPTTVWIVAEEKEIDGELCFLYESLELTQNPIFSQFISLIGLGIITFDWRGKVKPDKTSYRDHGHGFRISPRYRKLLFGDTKEILI